VPKIFFQMQLNYFLIKIKGFIKEVDQVTILNLTVK